MATNDGKIILGLDIPKTASQINADIKKLQGQLAEIEITGSLNNNATVKKINKNIDKLQSQLKDLDIETKIQTPDAKSLGQKVGKTLVDSIQETIDKETISIDHLEADVKVPASSRGFQKLGAALKKQVSQAFQSLKDEFSLDSALTFGMSKAKESIAELIKLDSILTEINQTSHLTGRQLEELGSSAFASASKYGKSASDYLTGVRDMYRSGFDNAEEMAGLSLLTQAAGSMESVSAENYLLATDAAYKYKGNVEELNKVLDSQSYIAGIAAVSLEDMANATSKSAKAAARYDVGIDELSALIAVAASKTRESGAEVGDALKDIFSSLQDTANASVAEAFDSVGVSMTKIINGSEQLKTPVELLKELSAAYNTLPDGDAKRANILTGIGQESHSDTLSAILSDWKSYESLLNLYPQGMGNAAAEAEKSVNSIEGSLNRLGNTWLDTVDNVMNSDAILTTVNALNGFLSVVNTITNALGSLGTIGLGAGLFSGIQNVGMAQLY